MPISRPSLPTAISQPVRSERIGQRATVVWFTGLSGAGKSTIATLVESRLVALGHHCQVLDGDRLRQGLNRDLGFSHADRIENIRRVAEVSRLMVDAGLIVLVALISPFRAQRDAARQLFEAGEFIEVYVDASLALVESRDTKGLYQRARRGELRDFTGIDSPYEPPLRPELHIATQHCTPGQAADQVLTLLRAVHVVR